MRSTSGDCTIKHNGLVIYTKSTYFVVKLVSFLLRVSKHTHLDKQTSLLQNLQITNPYCFMIQTLEFAQVPYMGRLLCLQPTFTELNYLGAIKHSSLSCRGVRKKSV
jgi:hypothetical protein